MTTQMARHGGADRSSAVWREEHKGVTTGRIHTDFTQRVCTINFGRPDHAPAAPTPPRPATSSTPERQRYEGVTLIPPLSARSQQPRGKFKD